MPSNGPYVPLWRRIFKWCARRKAGRSVVDKPPRLDDPRWVDHQRSRGEW